MQDERWIWLVLIGIIVASGLTPGGRDFLNGWFSALWKMSAVVTAGLLVVGMLSGAQCSPSSQQDPQDLVRR